MSEHGRAFLIRYAVLAWALLAVAVTIRMGLTLFLPNGGNLIDLHVYVDGAATMTSGQLYDYTYDLDSTGFPLPFTYPPFAAVLFYPLHWFPFALVGFVWQLATIAALFGVIRIAMELVVGEAVRGKEYYVAAALWTALTMWMEPVRANLDLGQVGLFLVLALMVAVRSSRWWLSGLLVGLTAGIKLTPAVTGLYFLARKQWRVVLTSAAAFGATVLVSWLLIGDQARTYFTDQMRDTSRIGPVGSANNQSMRGALSRLAGHDVGTGLAVAIGLLTTAVLCVLAWRALDPQDRLGQLLIVQFLGLFASPISWDHHWIWVIPLLIWLAHGPLRAQLGTRILCWMWALVMLVGVSSRLFSLQPSRWDFSRPGYLAWLGTVNITLALATLVWMAVAGRRARAAATRSSVSAAAPAR